jgi:aquaporin Z
MANQKATRRRPARPTTAPVASQTRPQSEPMAAPLDGAQLEHLAELHPAAVAIARSQRLFADPRREGRRLFSELLGTFLLVLVGAGGGVVNAVSHGAISRAAAVTAPGLTVLAIILFMGAVSGAHLNPAVSIAFAARGDFPWRRVPGYIVAQLIGATLACLFLWAVFGRVAMLGATDPGPHISDWQALLIEFALTAGLVSVILGTASGAQNLGPISAFGVGAYIILAGLWSSPISGASMNPARSFGPDLALLDFDHYWVYLVGPIAGGLLAVGIAWLLRGPGGDLPAILAAQGKLDFPDDRQPR